MAWLYLYTISILLFSCAPHFVSSDIAFGKTFICSHGKNASTTYKNNINRILSNFTSQSYKSNYYSTSIGDSPDIVYGYYMCRGDITSRVCNSCIVNATQFAAEANCEYGEGLAFSDKCMFRYANHSMYGVWNNGSTVTQRTGSSSVADTELFNQTISSIAKHLIKETAFGGNNSRGDGSKVGFATKDMNITGKEGMTIYSLAQCTPDIIGVNCSRCLTSAFDEFQRCCNGYLPAVVFKPNCLIMYDNVTFYELDEKDVSDEEQGLKPPIVEDKGRLSKGNGLEVTNLILVVNVMLFFVFVVY